jgi:hypothetical protein
MKNLNSIYASWLKVFIASILGAYLVELQNGTTLFQLEFGHGRKPFNRWCGFFVTDYY